MTNTAHTYVHTLHTAHTSNVYEPVSMGYFIDKSLIPYNPLYNILVIMCLTFQIILLFNFNFSVPSSSDLRTGHHHGNLHFFLSSKPFSRCWEPERLYLDPKRNMSSLSRLVLGVYDARVWAD